MIHSIQVLRFIAAMLVTAYHAAHFTDQNIVALPPALMQFFVSGASGVHIFFVISGFIMVWTSHEKFGSPNYVGEFLKRRFVRIFPIYWVLGTLNVPLMLGFGLAPPLTPATAAGAALLLPGYATQLIFVGWTLSYEVLFYLAFGAFVGLRERYAVLGFSLAFMGLMASRLLLNTDSAFVDVITNSLLLEFLFGAWIAWAVVNGIRLSRFWSLLVLIAGLVGFGIVGTIGHDAVPTAIGWGIPSALVVSGVVLLEQQKALPKPFLSLSHLGDSSYSLYLLHAMLIPPATLLLARVVQPSLAVALVLIVVITGGCIGLAHLVYHRLEKTLIGVTRRLISPRVPANVKP